MTTTIYSKKKNAEVKTYKMISDSVGFIFKFATDNVEKFMEEYRNYHGYSVNKFTYQEVK